MWRGGIVGHLELVECNSITSRMKFRSLSPYEAFKDVSPRWSKEENWRIAREMTLDEIDSTDLGQFLKSL